MEHLISSLSLSNFKAFGEQLQTAPMSKITLIYGPNSGGKSSIVQALLLLKQSVSGRDQAFTSSVNPRGEFVDLAGFRSMVHKHDTEREINVGLVLNAPYYPFAEVVQIDMTFGDENDLPILRRARYRLEQDGGHGLDIELVKVDPDAGDSETGQISRRLGFRLDEEQNANSIDSYIRFACGNAIRHEHFSRAASVDILGDGGRVDVVDVFPTEELISNLRSATFQTGFFPSFLPIDLDIHGDKNSVTVTLTDGSEQVIEFVSHNFRLSLVEVVQQLLLLTNEISYLGSLLEEPRRYYSGAIGDYFSVGARGEHTFDMIAKNPVMLAVVNWWFKKFGIPYTLDIIRDVGHEEFSGAGAINIVVLVDGRTETSLTLADVGFGISQILPVIVEGIAGRSDVICVDQPEVHLHPKLQAEIAELMIATRDHDHKACEIHDHDCCKDKDTEQCDFITKQWIVETHSELLVRRIQSHIAEGTLGKDEVSVLYVEPSENGSKIKPLELDEQGEFIEDWPEGFFDESTAEILRVLRRQRDGS
ncbi:MAG: DUF3696 domain-containing protein [Dehalococcoidia bacterium]|nr:DUF3696 domain-containing protein [Dehalococcoidia bacterium]